MPHPTEAVAVRHPETGQFEALNPAVNYPADDVFVKAYPWAFRARVASSEIVESVAIEKATAAPGEKRSRRS
jgi:hypothetical protein